MVRPSAEKIDNALDAFFDYLYPVSFIAFGLGALVACAYGWKPSLNTIAGTAFVGIANTGSLMLRNLITDRRAKK